MLADAVPVSAGSTITDVEFKRLRGLFHRASGIWLADTKKVLVCGRLAKRLRALGLRCYRDYLDLIERPDQAAERQTAVDLLTTNETHFFREPRHFELLRQELARDRSASRAWRVWSAACSTGEEPYSLAMTFMESLGEHRAWSVHATDLSTQVLAQARQGLFGAQRVSEIPRALAQRYCLEGFDEYTGQYLIDRSLRQRVSFGQVNLMEPLPPMEPFDVVFLRNVLIYFDQAAKRQIVEAVAQRLRPGGLLFIGHSETLGGVTDVLDQVVPTVYRRPG
jgi:chemotaxis protein methyltransferase CheR